MKNDETWKDFHRFNRVRENLFNTAMEGLGLHYRFKCVIITPGIENSIRRIVENPIPPSPCWWEDHCFLVNGFGLPNMINNLELTFCDFKTKYQANWALIQPAFNVAMKFKRYEYIKGYPDSNLESMGCVLSRIRAIMEEEHAPEVLDNLLIQITQELDEAVKSFESGSKISITPRLTGPVFIPRGLQILHKAGYRLRSMKDFVYLHVFERYKLKNRLSRPGIECPASGDVDAFEWWKVY